MTLFDPFAYRPAATPDESAQRLVSEVAHRLGTQERANIFAAFVTYAPWVSMSYVNSWADDPSDPLHFYRDPVGRVYLEGTTHRTLATLTGPVTIATLPLGYRPTRNLVAFNNLDAERSVFAVKAGGTPSGLITAEILTDGTVRLPFGNPNHNAGEDWYYTFQQKWQWRVAVPAAF